MPVEVVVPDWVVVVVGGGVVAVVVVVVGGGVVVLVVVVVGGVVVVVVVVGVVVEVVVVGVDVVVVVVVEVLVLVVAAFVVTGGVLQAVAASSPTVLAPWLRLAANVPSIPDRFATSLLNVVDAWAACAHWPAATAEEIEPRSLFKVLAWSLESSPPVLPQAASTETANPSVPARTARGALRIRGVTLEGGPVALALGSSVQGAWTEITHCPNDNRSASESGSLAARIADAAPAMSYSVRR